MPIPTSHVRVYLKGWRDSNLYTDAVNNDNHPLHDAAYREYLRSFRPYKPGDAVYLAIEYDVPALDDAEHVADQLIAENAFNRFNVGDPTKDDVVREYRAERNRSLSVGDVVEIDDRAYTVDHFGFKRLDVFLP